MDKLQEQFSKLLRETTTAFHRYMYDIVNWDNRMIGFIEPRGVGKTQHIKEIYNMQGLSFREYLKLFRDIDMPKYDLNDILAHKVILPDGFRPLAYFGDYLEQGYYPFALDHDFDLKLQQIVNQSLETDIPQFAEMNVSTGRKLKQLLAIIARSVPFKPNISAIATALGSSRNSIADFKIDDMIFEVSGKNKKQKQLEGAEKGYVVKGDIETGYANVIPLWQLGLEY